MEILPDHLYLVKKILRTHLEDCEIRAFGSRVGGTSKKHSDLDLAVLSQKPISPKVMAFVKEAFSESDLPFKVDLVDWSLISDEFKRVIEKKYMVIQEASIK